jgi:hypothetical protein
MRILDVPSSVCLVEGTLRVPLTELSPPSGPWSKNRLGNSSERTQVRARFLNLVAQDRVAIGNNPCNLLILRAHPF